MPRNLYPSETRKIREMINLGFTDREIAKALHVARASISNLRNEYQGDIEQPQEQPETIENIDQANVQPESYDQDVDDYQDVEQDDQYQDTDSEDESEQNTETSEDYEPSEEESIEDTEEPTCQNCGTPKSKWWTIDQAIHYGWRTKEKELWAWDYVCPKCGSPQSLKKCPDCGANISHFIEIRKTNVSEEQKQKYDLVCDKCKELIKVDDL